MTPGAWARDIGPLERMRLLGSLYLRFAATTPSNVCYRQKLAYDRSWPTAAGVSTSLNDGLWFLTYESGGNHSRRNFTRDPLLSRRTPYAALTTGPTAFSRNCTMCSFKRWVKRCSIAERQEQCEHSEEMPLRLANHPLVGAAIQLAFESL